MTRFARNCALVFLAGFLLTVAAREAYAGIVQAWTVTTTSTSPFTGDVPTTACNTAETFSATTGLALKNCKAYYVCIAAASGQTLSGAGTLQAYYFEPVTPGPEWMRASGGDESVPAAAASLRFWCGPRRDIVGGGSSGCGYWVPAAVTTSGGTTVQVFARCLQ